MNKILKPKIVLFINTLYSGGAEKQVLLLAKELKNNYNVFIVLFYGYNVDKKNIFFVEENNLKIISLNGSHYKKIISFYDFLKKEHINVVFSFLLLNNFIGGVLSLFINKTTFIGGIRSSFLPKKKIFLNKIACNFFNKKTIINNYSGIEFLKKHKFNIDKLEIIPNGIEVYDVVLDRNDDEIVRILSVGRFDISKDYITSLKVISKLLNETKKEIEYTIVGYGELENEIKSFIDKEKIGNRVKMVINPSNIEYYYSNASIFLQSSIFEGMSNTLMEAMTFSLPIVTTNVGDNKMLVEDNVNGYVCEPKNINQLLEKLNSLVNSKEKRSLFGGKSFTKIAEDFSIEACSKKYIHLIENL